jgi:hypothetical protein
VAKPPAPVATDPPDRTTSPPVDVAAAVEYPADKSAAPALVEAVFTAPANVKFPAKVVALMLPNADNAPTLNAPAFQISKFPPTLAADTLDTEFALEIDPSDTFPPPSPSIASAAAVIFPIPLEAIEPPD